MKVPFSVYDFFGYLAAGFVCLASLDFAFARGWLLDADPKLIPGIVLLFIAYVIGHAVAHVAWSLIEERFVRDVLRSPEETMFEDSITSRWARVFPGFYKPLPPEIQRTVLDSAKDAGITKPGRGLFYHCHSIAIRDEATRERLATFLNLYGFARNLVVAGVFAALVLLVGSFRGVLASPRTFHWDAFLWCVASLGLAVIMLYRYLKFFRHFTSEVFRSYAATCTKRNS
jgi:hypothetical protein